MKNKLDVSVNADKKNPGFSFIYNDKKGDEKGSKQVTTKEKVRVGGIWKQTGKMYGVLEEHYGTW